MVTFEAKIDIYRKQYHLKVVFFLDTFFSDLENYSKEIGCK